MAESVLRVLDFTETPGPRYIDQGPSSGEQFYLDVLNQQFADCIKHKRSLSLELDGVAGYPSSFLDQALGELVYDFSADLVKRYLKFKTIRFASRLPRIINDTIPNWQKIRENGPVPHNSLKAKGRKVYYQDKDEKIKEREL
jgi:hypothetical protein